MLDVFDLWNTIKFEQSAEVEPFQECTNAAYVPNASVSFLVLWQNKSGKHSN